VDDGIPYQVKQGQTIWASLQKIWKRRSIPIATKIRPMKALVWPSCSTAVKAEHLELKNEETRRLDAFEMNELRKILRVSWTTKKTNETNEWVLNKAGVKRELLDTVKARKLAYYGHTMRKQGSCLEKEIMQGTISGARFHAVRPFVSLSLCVYVCVRHVGDLCKNG